VGAELLDWGRGRPLSTSCFCGGVTVTVIWSTGLMDAITPLADDDGVIWVLTLRRRVSPGHVLPAEILGIGPHCGFDANLFGQSR